METTESVRYLARTGHKSKTGCLAPACLCNHSSLPPHICLGVTEPEEVPVSNSSHGIKVFQYDSCDLQDRDECTESPSICGERIKCLNTPGKLYSPVIKEQR